MCEQTEETPQVQVPELEANVAYPGTIKKIEETVINFTDRDTGDPVSKDVLKWSIEIDDPMFVNERGFAKRVYGTCDTKLNNLSDNRFRRWAEAVIGVDIQPGMKVDPQDWIQLPVMVKIWKRKGTGQYATRFFDEIAELLPFNGETEPPF